MKKIILKRGGYVNDMEGISPNKSHGAPRDCPLVPKRRGKYPAGPTSQDLGEGESVKIGVIYIVYGHASAFGISTGFVRASAGDVHSRDDKGGSVRHGAVGRPYRRLVVAGLLQKINRPVIPFGEAVPAPLGVGTEGQHKDVFKVRIVGSQSRHRFREHDVETAVRPRIECVRAVFLDEEAENVFHRSAIHADELDDEQLRLLELFKRVPPAKRKVVFDLLANLSEDVRTGQ